MTSNPCPVRFDTWTFGGMAGGLFSPMPWARSLPGASQTGRLSIACCRMAPIQPEEVARWKPTA